ncbi:MAG: glycosyltransferase, partial [Desulfuromonadales bacterium]|nr:glycosyltransferase [Desulfuromonadales bacterium]
MIKVLHAIDTTGSGGAETVFVSLVKGLDVEQFESIAAIGGPGWVCDVLRKNGVEPVFVKSKGSFNLHYLKALVQIVKEHKIDLIQSHLLGSNLYCSLAGLICRVPVISTIHGFVDVAEKENLVWLKSKLINIGSSRIVFVSDRLREHYVAKLGFSAKKSITIHNGVDLSTFYPDKNESLRRELGIGPQQVVIGAVGNIRKSKGYDVFLKAARLVYAQNPECRFVVAGQGAGVLFEELLQLRKELNLEGIFHFVGFQSDAAKVLNNFDIFVLPSITEGFSISTVEAMACGLPVIVTKSGGPEEIVADSIDGLMVSAGDPEGLAACCTKL